MNPAALAQKKRAEELIKLSEENERLKKRVEVLEESKGQAQDVTFQVEQKMSEAPCPSKKVEEMKKMLETEELKNKRLLEVFKKTSQELREVCYQLMGYKIDMPCANKYKITSLYAESPEDFFMFEVILGRFNFYSDKLYQYFSIKKYFPFFVLEYTFSILYVINIYVWLYEHVFAC